MSFLREPRPDAVRIREIFDRLIDLDAEEREARLREECGTDERLLPEVRALLEADGRAEQVLGPQAGFILPGQPRSPAPDFLPFALGSLLSHYRVVGLVGQGGMGVVVHARDVRLERDVALKLLPPAAAPSPEAKQRLLREARAASALDHPNVCTIYEVDEAADGQLFIAMPLYEGETLASRLRRGPLPLDEALDLGIQIADGLSAAHAANLVHCDVKPSNVVITPAGRVKLLDFGIARWPSESTGSGAVRGTLAYMAPEQLRGEALDARTDLWALGVLLYECVTGTNPFRAATDAATMHRILHQAPPPLVAEVPAAAALQAILERMLRPRAERYATAAAVRADLERARRGLHSPLTSRPGEGTQREALPIPLTRLIGREAEIGRIGEMLRGGRLVTLTGPAGTGKTRLALEVVHRLAPEFAGSACFVPLAAVTDANLVASEIAALLGAIDHPSRAAAEVLRHHIGGSELLLALDNFEQVVAAAPLLTELLTSCPALRILVTSRVVLRLRGEQELSLEPLASPDPAAIRQAADLEAYPATALFLERARAVRPEVAVGVEEARTIAAICRHLEGLPLALELAAARTRLFPPAALLERLSYRLDVLSGGARDLPERHRTLRDAIAWSYHLLETDEQRLLRRMGVFAGGAGLEMVERVCARENGGPSMLETLTALAEHSLLQLMPDAADAPRFTMLETVREYALERLTAEDDEERVRRLHAEAFLQLAEAAAAALTGSQQRDWLRRLQSEHDNLRAALGWAEMQGEAEIALRLGAALWRFWIVRGHVREGRQRLERLLRLPAGPHLRAARVAVRYGAGVLIHETGDYAAARPVLQDALADFRDLRNPAAIAATLNTLAWIDAHVAPLDAAERTAQQALELCEEQRDERGTAVALHNLAWIAYYRGIPRRAIALAAESLAIRESLGDRRGAAFVLANRARAECQTGEYAAAHASLARAEAIAHELDDRQLPALVKLAGGQVLLDGGRYAEAVEVFSDAVRLWRAVSHDFATGDCLNRLADAELELGHTEAAAAHLAEAAQLWRWTGGRWGEAARLHLQGRLARRAGDPRAAEQQQRSLELRREIGDLLGEAECLEELALLAAAREDGEEAAACLRAAVALRLQLGAPLPRRRGHEIAALIPRREVGADPLPPSQTS